MKSNEVTLKALLKPSTDPDRIPSACDVLNMTEWQPTNQPTGNIAINLRHTPKRNACNCTPHTCLRFCTVK